MKIVTAGSAYMDIDAYAACIAEAERLVLAGEEAYAASSAPLNESIPRSLRALNVGLTTYRPSDNDEFIVIDLSKEEYFDEIVKNGTVIEVIDHHPGSRQYWVERLGDKADIELIGASCTQIFERWERDNKLSRMNPETARLLAAGILDNTLNLKAVITTKRDIHAYKTLRRIGKLAEDFAAQYFHECQQAIDQDFETALRNDTKTVEYAPQLPLVLGQLTVWDAKEYTTSKLAIIEEVLSAIGDEWVLNLISIEEGKSYLVSNNPSAQKKLETLLGVTFKSGVAETDRLWLRKELIHLALGEI